MKKKRLRLAGILQHLHVPSLRELADLSEAARKLDEAIEAHLVRKVNGLTFICPPAESESERVLNALGPIR